MNSNDKSTAQDQQNKSIGDRDTEFLIDQKQYTDDDNIDDSTDIASNINSICQKEIEPTKSKGQIVHNQVVNFFDKMDNRKQQISQQSKMIAKRGRGRPPNPKTLGDRERTRDYWYKQFEEQQDDCQDILLTQMILQPQLQQQTKLINDDSSDDSGHSQIEQHNQQEYFHEKWQEVNEELEVKQRQIDNYENRLTISENSLFFQKDQHKQIIKEWQQELDEKRKEIGLLEQQKQYKDDLVQQSNDFLSQISKDLMNAEEEKKKQIQLKAEQESKTQYVMTQLRLNNEKLRNQLRKIDKTPQAKNSETIQQYVKLKSMKQAQLQGSFRVTSTVPVEVKKTKQCSLDDLIKVKSLPYQVSVDQINKKEDKQGLE